MTNQTLPLNTAAQLDAFLATGGDGKRSTRINSAVQSGMPTVSDFYKAGVINMSEDERKQVIADLETALQFIPADERKIWVKVGHALYWLDDGYRIWIGWSKTSSKFDQVDADKVWGTFHKTKIGYQVIFKMAADNGWVNPWRVKASSSSAVITDGVTVDSETGELVAEPKWVDVNANGVPLPTIENTELFLKLCRINYYFDEMLKERIFNFPNVALSGHNRSNNSITQIKSLASKYGLSRDAAVENAMTLADSTLYHPAREWIESVEWDGVSRYAALFNSLDPVDRDIAHMLLRVWLISCIAALYEPKGVAAQGVLVLQGLQGCGKTSWLKRLCGNHAEFFRESLILNPSNKDSVKLAVTRWIEELGELGATFRKSDLEEIKAFITRDEDEIRLPYAAAESKWSRRTIFCASVNDTEFLHDTTGNRRFWSIPVNNPQLFNMPDMQQVWAEVKSWYDAGESWVLSSEQLALLNDSNLKHSGACPIEESIISGFDWQSADRSHPMTTTEICHRIGIDHPNKSDTRTVGKVVRQLLNVSEPRKSNGSKVFDMPSRGDSPTGY